MENSGRTEVFEREILAASSRDFVRLRRSEDQPNRARKKDHAVRKINSGPNRAAADVLV
jgi:hypothetical protein